MRILWVKTDFLHPTTRGGQIRSLETLRQLHRRHEIHYVAYNDPSQPEGLKRAGEYCSASYPVAHPVVEHNSVGFALQVAAGLFSKLPVAVARYNSDAMRRAVTKLLSEQRFDRLVCDFLFPAASLPDLADWTLFQHNVEALIWQRRTARSTGFAEKSYLALQARRMLAFEGDVSRRVRKVLAVSDADASLIREMYGVQNVFAVPTGVDLEYFTPPKERPPLVADLSFVGSMDWMPNADGAAWFVRQVLPRIHQRRPETTVALIGRKPDSAVRELAGPHVKVTGTVPDVRPYLFGSLVSIVPLHVGGGTRLKIYEAMAARVPVIATTIGAEGLDVIPQENIVIADKAEEFASACLLLLESAAERERIACAAWNVVSARYSWEAAGAVFEKHLLT
jgi:polysaccharide biosynthesis protein PslH